MARDIENMTEAANTQTRKAVLAAQDVAERAGSYAQQQMTNLSGRAQELARDASDRIKEYTGRPVEDWLADVRGFVRAHPLKLLAATIGIGYVLGKIARR